MPSPRDHTRCRESQRDARQEHRPQHGAVRGVRAGDGEQPEADAGASQAESGRPSGSDPLDHPADEWGEHRQRKRERDDEEPGCLRRATLTLLYEQAEDEQPAEHSQVHEAGARIRRREARVAEEPELEHGVRGPPFDRDQGGKAGRRQQYGHDDRRGGPSQIRALDKCADEAGEEHDAGELTERIQPAPLTWTARLVNPASAARAQSGTLNQNTARHPNAPVKTPPRRGPTTRPSDPSPAQMPMARARSAGSRRDAFTSASDAGRSAAAPMPWRTRAAISAPGVGARAHAAVAAPKVTRPNTNTRRRPNPSAMWPALSIRLPSARA